MVQHFPIIFDPGIFKVLGEELVSDPVIAIQELVKNAYDADSKTCSVTIDSQNKSVIIQDFGHGMDEDSIKNGWLNIGTPIKRNSIKSKSGKRYVTGSKGVGRLSVFTLGNVINIITVDEDNIERKFELELDKLINLKDIKQYYVKVEDKKVKEKSHTKIIIKDVKVNVDKEFIDRLPRMLSILVAPKMKKEFKINLMIDGKDYNIDPEVQLGAYLIQISTKVDELGIATIDITGEKALYKGNQNLKHETKILLKKYTLLKNIDIDLRWYLHGSKDGVTMWEETPSNLSKDLREISGIRIYRDGVRVLPYGEKEDDSFRIEAKYISHGSKSKFPRKIQIIGWIYTARKDNPQLIDTSNREGLLNNTAYKELCELIDETFQEFREYRTSVEQVPKEKKPDVSDTKKIKTVINNMKKQTSLLTLSNEELTNRKTSYEKIQKNMNSNISMVASYFDKVEYLLDVDALYRDRITAGNMINNILHYVGAATNSAREFIEIAANMECDQISHKIALTKILDLLPRIIAAYDVLKGGSMGVERAHKFNLLEKTKPLVENLVLTSSIRPNQITLDCENIEVHMRESDYWAIVANLLLNAITCHDYEQCEGRPFSKKNERQIYLLITRFDKDLVIQCEDNGPGLPDKPQGWIWQQFTSTRKPAGSGLGLFIVSEIVTYYKGNKYAASSSQYPHGAHFYIQLKDVVI